MAHSAFRPPALDLMNTQLALKIGAAFFHAGKSENDLLSYWGGDKKDNNFRKALGMFGQLRSRKDDGDDTDFVDATGLDDDRSSEEHNEEADRLEALASKEKDPKVKSKLEDRAEFHREEVGLDSVSLKTLRKDNTERSYALEKLKSNLKELKRRADEVFERAEENEFACDDDDDCSDSHYSDEEVADAGTGRTVR